MADDSIQPIPDLPTALRNVVQLLQTDPKVYRSFGCYWWGVKAILKRHGYTKDNLYLLGDYVDEEALSHLPAEPDEYLLAWALDEHRHNMTQNLGSADVYFPDDGEPYHLQDPDTGGI